MPAADFTARRDGGSDQVMDAAMALSVDICAATFRRPARLLELLRSLERQRVDPGIAIRIVIVDNDAQGSGRAAVDAVGDSFRFPILYECEPRRGIVFARNRCLALSNADWLAFIDDDEVATDTWLDRLLDTAIRFSADIVVGPVLARLPPDAPRWIVRGNLFARKRYPTGKLMAEGGGTGNALISGPLLKRAGRGFDLAHNLTGGEDSEFFAYLQAMGARKVFCNEAEATETIPPERATLRWLLRRSFRGGQDWARVRLPRRSVAGRIVWFLQYLAYLGVAAVGVIALLPLGVHWSARALMRASSYCGQLSAPFGHWYEEYGIHER